MNREEVYAIIIILFKDYSINLIIMTLDENRKLLKSDGIQNLFNPISVSIYNTYTDFLSFSSSLYKVPRLISVVC